MCWHCVILSAKKSLPPNRLHSVSIYSITQWNFHAFHPCVSKLETDVYMHVRNVMWIQDFVQNHLRIASVTQWNIPE